MLETLRKLEPTRVLEDLALLVYILEPREVYIAVKVYTASSNGRTYWPFTLPFTHRISTNIC